MKELVDEAVREAPSVEHVVVWRRLGLDVRMEAGRDLFWDEAGLMQLLAGAGVGGLLAHLGVMGFLLDTQRAALRGRAYRARWAGTVAVGCLVDRLPRLTEAAVLLSGYLLRSSLPLLVLTLTGGLRAPEGVSPWWLPLGGIVCFGLYSAGSVWIAGRGAPHRNPLWSHSRSRKRPSPGWERALTCGN